MRRKLWIVLVAAALSVATFLSLPPRAAFAHAPHDVIGDIALSPTFGTDHTVFAISRHRLLRSSNLGGTWAELVNGLANDHTMHVAAAPSDRNVLYASVELSGVYRSADQGSTWRRTAAQPGGSTAIADLVVSLTSRDTVFAQLTSGALYRTTDAGAHWTAVGSLGTVTSLVIASATNDVLAGTASGIVARSRDGGTTWTTATGLPANVPVTALTTAPTGSVVFAGTRSGKFFRSVDGGASFVGAGTGLPAEQVMSIATSNNYATDGTLWVSTWRSVYRSANHGNSFVRKASGLIRDVQADEYGVAHFGRIRVGVDANGTQILYVAGFAGLFRSTSGGENWQPRETLTEYVTGLAVSPDYARDGTVVAATYVKGAYISRDRGATWPTSFVGLTGAPGTDFSSLQRLQSTAFSPNYASDRTMFMCSSGIVFRSTNAGASWADVGMRFVNESEPRCVLAVSPNYATDHTVFAVSKQMWRSQASGASGSWSLRATLDSKARSVVLSPRFATDGVMYAGTQSGVYRSIDAGAHWARTGPSGVSMLAISPNYAVDRTVFAGTSKGLYVTRDAGTTWATLSASPLSPTIRVEALALSTAYATDGTVLVSVRGTGLFRSTDRGNTFVATGASLIARNILLADFDAPTSQPIQFSPAYASDHTVFAYGQTHVVKSTDGGSTWQVIDLPPAAAVFASL
jgi:photosystem II stability/assembly factor-like uncharacterized protein